MLVHLLCWFIEINFHTSFPYTCPELQSTKLTCPKKEAEAFDQRKCQVDPSGRTDVDDSPNFLKALGDAVIDLIVLPLGGGYLACSFIDKFATEKWNCSI